MAQLPFAVKQQLDDGVRWGDTPRGLGRFEIRRPFAEHETRHSGEAAAVVHAGRASLMVRVSGGHLPLAPSEILSEVLAGVPSVLSDDSLPPAAYVRRAVAWLEGRRVGELERSHVTASLIVVVGHNEYWTWSASPHGVVAGASERLVFRSTDLRTPVLREIGVLPPSPFRMEGLRRVERASSIFCVGTPVGYEFLRLSLAPGEFAIVADEGFLPFGPLSDRALTLSTFWSMDAGWKHDIGGLGIVVGEVGSADLEVPPCLMLTSVGFPENR